MGPNEERLNPDPLLEELPPFPFPFPFPLPLLVTVNDPLPLPLAPVVLITFTLTVYCPDEPRLQVQLDSFPGMGHWLGMLFQLKVNGGDPPETIAVTVNIEFSDTVWGLTDTVTVRGDVDAVASDVGRAAGNASPPRSRTPTTKHAPTQTTFRRPNRYPTIFFLPLKSFQVLRRRLPAGEVPVCELTDFSRV
jgi:hypothetical protein